MPFGAIASASQASDADRRDPADLSIEEVKVTATRLQIRAVGQKQTVLPLDSTPVARLDDILASVPGVSLFRRANSLSANPTTQGLTMRGVGANAAGRVLVTLDGVPLNDPFGGWINWASLPADVLSGVSVNQGGGAGAFGAEALAGSVTLTSRKPDGNSGYARVAYGSFETIEIASGFSLGDKKAGIRFDAGAFETDGFNILREDERGPIDVPAASDVARFSGSGFYNFGGSELFVSARYFDETRINGFANAPNSTEGFDASVRLVSDHSDDLQSEILLYTRHRTLKNTFVSARDNRTVGRQVLDQVDVPGSSYGFLARLQSGDLEVGVDGQLREGETNEIFRNLGGGFTRGRTAGGEQALIGAYAEWSRTYDRLSVAVMGRLDAYTSSDGSRLEQDLADSAILLDQAFPEIDGVVPAGRLGATYSITPALTLRGNAYRTWRLPTLNEFYRPFRVGNDITEANPELQAETLWGFDTGLSYQPLSTIKLDLTYFRSWLENGVGNITLGFGPGFLVPGGFVPGQFVPGGGTLRQRSAVDLVVTDGIEASGEIQLSNGWSVIGRYQWIAARISAFDDQPDLVRNRPIQTPTHQAFAQLAYNKPWGGFVVEGRYSSSQFDDDQNRRRLPDAFTVNASIRYLIPGSSVTAVASVENLFDEEVISAQNAAGLVTLAQPQFFRIGAEVRF